MYSSRSKHVPTIEQRLGQEAAREARAAAELIERQQAASEWGPALAAVAGQLRAELAAGLEATLERAIYVTTGINEAVCTSFETVNGTIKDVYGELVGMINSLAFRVDESGDLILIRPSGAAV
jgi:hypothetical protein